MKPLHFITAICTAFTLCTTPAAYSQNSSDEPAFSKGSNVISVGIGIGGAYTYFGDGYTATPNFVLAYDNGTFGNVGPGTISLGALFAYKGIGYNYSDFHSGYFYNQNWNYYIIGVRSAYHLSIASVPRFDPYIGIMLAYYDISYKETSNDPYFDVPGNPYYYYYSNSYASYLAFSMYIGARYNVSNHIGFWLELGYGYSNAAIGISFKL